MMVAAMEMADMKAYSGCELQRPQLEREALPGSREMELAGSWRNLRTVLVICESIGSVWLA